MTATYRLRTDLSTRLPAPAERLLDWAPGNRAATIQVGEDFHAGWRPTRESLDLMLLGASAFCIDKTASRADQPDAWTRALRLHLAVADPTAWASSRVRETLAFLTGDRWDVAPHLARSDPLAEADGAADAVGGVAADAVCLFSGGLDSLCGAIDLLERNPDWRVVLLGHYEGGGQAPSAQENLHARLAAAYGAERVVLRQLFLRPAPANGDQARPLPNVAEQTTRSRSLLFLSAALAVASGAGHVPVYVPENGFIGVNAPLTRARSGSLSTRTTHPHFMALLDDLKHGLGVRSEIRNPYRLFTKGEMLQQSSNPTLLKDVFADSVSCAHPEAARWQKRPQGNCGYCFPCLIRRSALAHVGWDDDPYSWDVLSDDSVLNPRLRRGADLRAILNGVFADRPDRDVLRNGPLPSGDRQAFLGVWRRGNQELRDWLTTGATGRLKQVVDSLA